MPDENDLNGKVGLDTTAFKTGVTQLTAQIKNIETGFRASAAVMGSWSTTSEGLTARTASLSEKLKIQKQALEILHTEFDKVVASEGADSKAAESLAKQMYDMGQKIQSTEKSLNKYNSQLKTVESQEKQNTSSLSKFKSGIASIADQSKKSASGISSSFSSIRGVIGGALAALSLSGLIKQGVEFNAAIEQYQASFKTMTGSAQKAAEITSTLKNVANATPFELKDLADTTQLLMNYGLTADQAIGKMQNLGDISQGNSDKMKSIATAYGQMSSAGKVQLEDVKQMIEAGYNPLNEISKKTGESMASLYSRISKGTLSVSEITKAMETSTAAGGKYYKSMDTQSKTLNGQLSTLKDTISGKLGEAMTSTSNKLTNEVVPAFTNFISNLNVNQISNSIASVFDKVKNVFDFVTTHGEFVKNVVIGIATGFAVFKTISTIISAVTTAMKVWESVTNAMKIAQLALNLVMSANPIGLIITAIGLLVAAFVVLWNNCEGFRNFWIGLWSGIQNVIGTVVEWIKSNWQSLVLFLVNPIAGIFNYFYQNNEQFRNYINGAIEKIKSFFMGVVDFVKNNWKQLLLFLVNPVAGAIALLYNNNPKFREWANSVGTAIKNGLNGAINWIKGLPGEALQWGKDIINGIVNGIKNAAGAVGDAVKGVAQNIRSFLHFSVPDEGPLSDFDSYMPDMMNGLAQGMTDNIGKIRNAARSVAGALSIATPQINVVSGRTANVPQQPSQTTNYNQYGAMQDVHVFSVDGQTLARVVEPKISQLGFGNSLLRNGAVAGA